MKLFWVLAWLLFSCEEKDLPLDEPTLTTATLRLRSAVNNSFLAEVPIYSSVDSTTILTEEDGRATVLVHQDSPYSITAATEADMAHIYQGQAGAEPFEVVGYLSDRATTESVYNYLGITVEQSTGIVVVALDYPNLSPVYGASAAISSTYDVSFVFGQTLPAIGDTLVENGSSFVSFANVALGPSSISVTPPEGVACRSFPAGQTNVGTDVEVYADTVTVAVFECE